MANDSEPNFLYINKGDGTFEDQGYISGFALNNEGREIASMGLAVGDYMNNGLVDLLVTDFSDDFKALYPQRWRRQLYRDRESKRALRRSHAFCGMGRLALSITTMTAGRT